MHVDWRRFEHSVVRSDREYEGLAIRKEGHGVKNGGEQEGVLFPLPNEGFD